MMKEKIFSREKNEPPETAAMLRMMTRAVTEKTMRNPTEVA